MLSIVASAIPTPPNLPAIAGFYSQLAGVLAGFSFAGLIALIAAQLTTKHIASMVLESGAPLLASFVALVVSSLNYAVVAGEVPGTARAATLQTLSGFGFSVAGIMLFYSILVLVRGLENDAPQSRPVTQAVASLIRVVIVFVVSPLVVMLMWGGLRDHTNAKYGDVGFNAPDWVAFLCLVASLTGAMIFFRFLFGKPRHHPLVTRRISYTAVVLVTLSILSCAALISFTDSAVKVPDIVPSTTVVLVAGFGLVVAYSASRYTVVDDHAPTTTPTAEVVDPDTTGTSSEDEPADSAKDDVHSKSVLEPIDHGVLARRSVEIFPQGYLTNISIIQGVALAAVTAETVKALTRTDNALPVWPTAAQSAFLFVAIVAVSYEYLWFTTVMRWTPTFRDTAIPMILGAAEIIPAFLIDRPVIWWAGTAAFTACGALAFGNSVTRLSEHMFPDKEHLYRDIRKLLARLSLICVVASIFSWSVMLLIAYIPGYTRVASGVGAMILVVPAALVIVAYSEHVLNKVYDSYGIARRPPLFQALGAARRQ